MKTNITSFIKMSCFPLFIWSSVFIYLTQQKVDDKPQLIMNTIDFTLNLDNIDQFSKILQQHILDSSKWVVSPNNRGSGQIIEARTRDPAFFLPNGYKGICEVAILFDKDSTGYLTSPADCYDLRKKCDMNVQLECTILHQYDYISESVFCLWDDLQVYIYEASSQVERLGIKAFFEWFAELYYEKEKSRTLPFDKASCETRRIYEND